MPYWGKKEIVGVFAGEAVRLSPYPCPKDLDVVCGDLLGLIEARWGRGLIFEASLEELATVLWTFIHAHVFVHGWNLTNNASTAPFQAVTRYDGPRNPDDDFIDLDALHMNILNVLQRHDEQAQEDSRRIAAQARHLPESEPEDHERNEPAEESPPGYRAQVQIRHGDFVGDGWVDFKLSPVEDLGAALQGIGEREQQRRGLQLKVSSLSDAVTKTMDEGVSLGQSEEEK